MGLFCRIACCGPKTVDYPALAAIVPLPRAGPHRPAHSFCALFGDIKMFAVIRTGGKQYKVAPNDVIKVERLPGAAGEIVELGEVLMLGDGDKVTVGAPLVGGACVGASVIAQGQGDKVLVFKKKRRHNYRRKNGHRQDLTILRITEILTDGQKPSKTVEAKPAPAAKAKKVSAKKKAAAAAEAKPKAKAAKPKAAKAKAKKE
jgi:large subunit ribosomal protein L21